MDVVENYWNNIDVVKECLLSIYNCVSKNWTKKRVVVPVTSVLFFYYFFVREVSGKRKKRILKKPCPSDRPYDGEDDHPFIPVVRIICFILFFFSW